MIRHKSTRRRAPLLWRKSDLKIKKRIDKLFSKKRNRKEERKFLNDMADKEMSDNLKEQRQGYEAHLYARVKNRDRKLFKKTK